MRPLRYILDGHTPKPEPSLLKWAEWFEASCAPGSTMRLVAYTEIDDHEVSTVFLGLDHNHFGVGPPVLFETMVFLKGDRGAGLQRRYCTWTEAEEGHARVVEQLRAAAGVALVDLRNALRMTWTEGLLLRVEPDDPE